MSEASIIGLDLAKNVFQAYCAGAYESFVFRRKLSRDQLLKFLDLPPGSSLNLM
jgi:transposase